MTISLSATDSNDLEPHAAQRRPLERWLRIVAPVRAGEGKATALFFAYALLLLVCYYLLKTVREPLLLTAGTAAQKSYASAAIAATLSVVVPLYGVLFRRVAPQRLVQSITVFFVANLAVFYGLGHCGFDIGFAYYVWVGVFSVTILAQFWAHAAHTYDVERGQRLFPIIMAGATLGALAGPKIAGALFPLLGPWNLLLLAMVLLLATLPLVERSAGAALARGRKPERATRTSGHHVLGGLALVLRDKNLLLLALLAVLLNCVNTTGEYVLTELMLRNAAEQIAQQPGLDKATLIAAFYGSYYFAVNAVTVVVQVFLVGRIFRWIGVRGALLVLPALAMVCYGLVAFLPIFAIIRAVKVIENSAEYSIMNTVRHVLFLPLPVEQQFEGKTAIDTFFWRLGDVVQAGVVYAGLHWLAMDFRQFALLNMLLAVAWIGIAVRIGRRYEQRAPQRASFRWRLPLVGGCAATVALVAAALPRNAAAGEPGLFTDEAPLALEVVYDARALCRPSARRDCADVPASLVYRDADGVERRVTAALRVRGKWRAEASNCSVPPLFVFFDDEATVGTLFEGQHMLPLTTHCREREAYEEYVLKEYLAYRIYNALTDKSLRVRLARITYRDAGGRGRSVERYGFFAEHFSSLAAREGAEVAPAEDFDSRRADPAQLATLELFEYLIGNTDWSIKSGHNILHVRDAAGELTAVPYDFDFSGLVNAEYAGPPPQLPIRTVTQRLFRGYCQAGFDWHPIVDAFATRRTAIESLIAGVPGLSSSQRAQARAYLNGFYEILASPQRREREIVAACRGAV